MAPLVLDRFLKCILRKHGYLPDKAERTTQTVLEQAEVLSEGWAEAEVRKGLPA
ncbi:MAG: DUF3387 domain-containing protein [Chromatiales bacterium]|nr:DUF3387 domain-containing protein [Chromatiales bacterium]